MKYFKVEYNCGFGSNETYITAESLKEAEEEAYLLAVDDYESYAGYHGIPDIQSIAEKLFNKPYDELTEDEVYDTELEYYQQMESWLSYSAEEIFEYDYLVGIGEIDE